MSSGRFGCVRARSLPHRMISGADYGAVPNQHLRQFAADLRLRPLAIGGDLGVCIHFLLTGTEGSNPSPSTGEVRTRPHGFGDLPPASHEPASPIAIGTRRTITLRNEAGRSGNRAHPEGMPLPPNALAEPAPTFRPPDAKSAASHLRLATPQKIRARMAQRISARPSQLISSHLVSAGKRGQLPRLCRATLATALAPIGFHGPWQSLDPGTSTLITWVAADA